MNRIQLQSQSQNENKDITNAFVKYFTGNSAAITFGS